VSGVQRHPFPLSFHMNTPWWVWKNALICWVISPAFFPVLTAWCNVSVWWNNFEMQVTKPMKAYRIACWVEVSQQIKLLI